MPLWVAGMPMGTAEAGRGRGPLAEEWAKERQVGKDTAGGGEWVRKG